MTCLLLRSACLPSTTPATYTAHVPPPSRRTFVENEKSVTFRMSVALWQRLQATSATLGQSQAQIMSAALETYLNALPAKDRQLIDSILARRQKPEKT